MDSLTVHACSARPAITRLVGLAPVLLALELAYLRLLAPHQLLLVVSRTCHQLQAHSTSCLD
jgi:hypothetical protein